MDKPEGFLVFNHTAKNSQKDLMIHIIEEFLDIPFPNMTLGIRFQELLGSFNGTEEPFVLPARPNIVNESFVVNFNEIIIDKPVDDPILYSGDGNFSPLIIGNHKFLISAVDISSIMKILGKIGKIFLQIILEFMQFRSLSFSFSEGKPATPNIS